MFVLGGRAIDSILLLCNAKTFRDVSFVNQGLQIAIEKRLNQPALNSKKYITIQFLNNGKDVEYINGYSSSVCCKENDVLMTRTGNTGIVVSGVSGVFHNNFFKINFDRKAIDKNYLIGYLNLDKTHKLILAKAGTSTIPDLNHNDFYSIPIPLPTLSEQEAIAQVLTDMDAEIEALEQKRDKYKAIKQGMMQELLTGRTRLV
jgi:type I restriction enzyme S subunit